MILSEKDIERMLRSIYTGKVNENELDPATYFAIADYLKEGLYKGFGISFTELKKALSEGTEVAFDQKDFELLAELRENIYLFSAAKAYQETINFQGIMVGEDGEIRSYKEFKEAAVPVNEQWNENWLKTEYDTAYGQAQNAVRWNQIEKNKDVLPVLMYHTTEDDRVCDICGPLDGMTAPVDDPIWDSLMPMQHFGCYCTISQEEEDTKLTPQDERDDLQTGAEKNMQPLFKMNPGKEKAVFLDSGKSKHPYFDVQEKDKAFAKENFGLPIPESDDE